VRCLRRGLCLFSPMGAAADYDVVIVGAGPGGLAAANALLIGDSSLRIKVAATSLLPARLTLTSLTCRLQAHTADTRVSRAGV